MGYEKLKEALRKLYDENDSFTLEVMNALSSVLWKAEQYDRIKRG